MTAAVSDLQTMISTMSPALNKQLVAYVSLPDFETPSGLLSHETIATFRESEGLTLIVDLEVAERKELPIAFRAAWITLTVHSDLAAVGLTAAFAKALGDQGISCNVMAAYYHDHIFVPVEKAELAMEALRALQRSALT
jgi:uncharacterized protein